MEVCLTCCRHFVRQFAEFRGQPFQDLAAIPAHPCTPAVEKGASGRYRQFDAQSCIGLAYQRHSAAR